MLFTWPTSPTTIKRPTSELRNWFGGQQSPDPHFAVRSHFALQAKRTGLHDFSLQAFGTLAVSVTQQDGALLAHWTHQGESSGPEFMFHADKLLQRESLAMQAGQTVEVTLEYRMRATAGTSVRTRRCVPFRLPGEGAPATRSAGATGGRGGTWRRYRAHLRRNRPLNMKARE